MVREKPLMPEIRRRVAYWEAPASYIIFKEDDMIYAKNGETGAIEFSGTDAATVIQQAIDNISQVGGGSIFVKSGVYDINSSIKLTSGIKIEGEGTGIVSDIGGADVYKQATIFRVSNTDIKHVFVVSDPEQSFNNIVIRDLAVRGAGLIKAGNSGEEWGVSNLLIENINVRFWDLYPEKAPIYALDIWHSLHVVAKAIYVDGGACLRFATDFTTKTWNFGNSVFMEIFGASAPDDIPMFHIYSAGDPNKTAIGLSVFIRPQSLGSCLAGLLLDGHTSAIRDVTVIAADLESSSTVPIVLRGMVSKVSVIAHYPWSVRLAKNPAGNKPEQPLLDVFCRYEYDDYGRIKLYDSDLTTVVGYIFPRVQPYLYDIPKLTWYDIPLIVSNDSHLDSPLDITALDYGSASNPFLRPVHYLKIPSGTTLGVGINTFNYWTKALGTTRYTPGMIFVHKVSGWEQANLDIQTYASWDSSANAFKVDVNIINRESADITLTSDLVFGVFEIPRQIY